jgi:hypothetical protein
VKIVSATVRGKAIPGAEVSLSREGAEPVTARTDASGRVSLDNPFGVDDESVLPTVRRPGFSPLVVECPCAGLTCARLVDVLGDPFKMNNRVKDAVIEPSDGTQIPVTFEDAAKETRIQLPEAKSVSWVKLTVESIYTGRKWNDLAVSELHALGTGQ